MKITLIIKKTGLNNYLAQLHKLEPIASSRSCEFGLVICCIQIGLKSSWTCRK